jgi:hypothetical protein
LKEGFEMVGVAVVRRPSILMTASTIRHAAWDTRTQFDRNETAAIRGAFVLNPG